MLYTFISAAEKNTGMKQKQRFNEIRPFCLKQYETLNQHEKEKSSQFTVNPAFFFFE